MESKDVWIDPDTNYMWQVPIDTKNYTWKESFEYAKKLNREKFGGFDDWRVPTIEELKTILTKESYENSKSSTGKTYIKKPLLDFMTMKYQWFWSSSSNAFNDDDAWYVNFNYGNTGSSNKYDS